MGVEPSAVTDDDEVRADGSASSAPEQSTADNNGERFVMRDVVIPAYSRCLLHPFGKLAVLTGFALYIGFGSSRGIASIELDPGQSDYFPEGSSELTCANTFYSEFFIHVVHIIHERADWPR